MNAHYIFQCVEICGSSYFHCYHFRSQTVIMTSMGFFIDTTGGKDDDKEEVEETEDAEVALGIQDVKTEAKMRQRASKERSLASFLFGNTSQGSEDESEQSESEEEDNVPESEEKEKEKEDEEESDDETVPSTTQPTLPGDLFLTGGRRKRKAAWQDEEDEEVLVKDVTATYNKAAGRHGEQETSTEQYQKAVTRKFKAVVGDPAWASLDREEGDSDEEFFRETTDMLDKKGRSEYLESGYLNSRKLKDLNFSSHKEGAVIKSVEFHPSSTVGLVAGNNGNVTLMQVDGKENPKIHTINFKDFPIKTAKFSSCGNEIIVGSSHHPHFFVYDMIAGQSRQVGSATQSARL